MPWKAPGEARLQRMVVTLLGILIFLHLLFMLRDQQSAWHATLVGPDEPSESSLLADEHETKSVHGQGVLSFIPTPPYVDLAAPPMQAHPFPRKIWQTGPDGAGTLDPEVANHIATWTKLNEDWRYEILTDAGAETYVKSTFGNRTEIVNTYMTIRDPILRADFLRYLILLGDGGVYCDTDTRALKPIDDWIPFRYRNKVNVVVGVEYDTQGGPRWADWTLDLQFTNWAMLAQPGHPLLELTVAKVIYALTMLAVRKSQSIAELKPEYLEVLDTTGPALFSMAIFEWVAASTGYEFSWQNVTKLREPFLVNDLLIMPVTAFGSEQPHSDSGPSDSQSALVQHMFRGSWKEDHPLGDWEDPPPEDNPDGNPDGNPDAPPPEGAENEGENQHPPGDGTESENLHDSEMDGILDGPHQSPQTGELSRSEAEPEN